MSTAAPVVRNARTAAVRASRERVDLWQVALGPLESHAARHSLSDSEREFAGRLRVGSGAWAAARAALRRVLGRYLALAPDRVPLENGASGKPRLAPRWSEDLRFNLSHSGALALIAVRLDREVGVDVEELRPGVDGPAILRDVLGAPERAAGTTSREFFRAWVRREALAKATGRGIVAPPAPEDAARFSVRDLDGIPGFAAALASEGADWGVRRVTE